ncbi:30S ribosomal protein S16 [Candidatus Legionella polyplacis]|uniref:Small ribosomal subunit protein bS16 n=1 Tax=Candidatus Legionella polyplacis TaxID=2005262 RepID=A0ABZ2GZY2_9GAMM|nr:30S ribosomal protein S16 [Candidatus Legionella polyplacis]ATW01884.1 30S ribosomal protein S16 [Candidatus Legionella polyplacis]
MLIIRLKKIGTKKKSFYKIIVIENKNKQNGKYIEKIGFFNSLINNYDKRLYLNIDRLNYWKNIGAKLSKRVNSLLKEKHKADNNL